MRAVVQRVSRASVPIDEETVGEIGRGLLVLLGVTHTDTAATAAWLADKVVGLRLFNDADGKMNRERGRRGRRRAGGQPVHAVRRLPEGPPDRASSTPPARRSPSRCTRRSSTGSRPLACRRRRDDSGR